MAEYAFDSLFSLTGRVVAVTGGSGVLGRALVIALLRAGAYVALIARDAQKAHSLFSASLAPDERLFIVHGDVTESASLLTARDAILNRFARIDALVNGAGGNRPQATTGPERSFFELPEAAFKDVLDINLLGTVLAT